MLPGSMSAKTQINKDVILIPFIKVRKLITVEANLNGEKRTFLLDNGAPDIVLNSGYINVGEETAWKAVSAQGANGDIVGMGNLNLKKFDFYGIRIENKEVFATDLSHLEKVLKTELYGLIGYDVIKDFDVLFDYEKHTITLINPLKTNSYLATTLKGVATTEIPLIMKGHIAAVEGIVADKTLSLGVDCGAEGNLFDSALFNLLQVGLVNLESKPLMGGDQIANTVKRATIISMSIGNKIFKDTATVFNDISHINNTLDGKIDGVIGYEILSTQKVILSYQSKKLIFIE